MNKSQEVKDYKFEFNKIFHKDIKSILETFEMIRKRYIFNLLTVLGILLSINYFIYIYFDKELFFLTYGVLITTIISSPIYSCLKKIFEKKLKQMIMDTLMHAFSDCHWSETAQISNEDIQDSGLFASYDTKSDDDNFSGTYKGVNFYLNETALITGSGKNRHAIFDGLLIKIDMNKNFYSHTVVQIAGMFKSSNRVTLEDTEFEKYFDVYSNDQIEARYILTPAFMERYKKLIKVFKTKEIQCSFKDNKALFAINTQKDMFAIGNLSKSVIDTKQYEELFDQISSIFIMIDILKLNLKIGL